MSRTGRRRCPRDETAASPAPYDYYGFPPETYRLTWPAPGATTLAARVRELLGGAGLESGEDAARGYDHGTFVPLMLTFPEADVPTTQLSLVAGLDPERHLAIGRALAPLRDEGVYIVGSGWLPQHREFRAAARSRRRRSMAGWGRRLRSTRASATNDSSLAEAPPRAARTAREHLLPLWCGRRAGGDRARSPPGSYMARTSPGTTLADAELEPRCSTPDAESVSW